MVYTDLDDAMDFGSIIVSPPGEPREVLAGTRCVAIIQFNDKVACHSRRHIKSHASAGQSSCVHHSSAVSLAASWKFIHLPMDVCGAKQPVRTCAISSKTGYKTCGAVAGAQEQAPN